MLRLDEPDVFLLMGSAIAVSAPLLWMLERRGIVTPLGGKLRLSRSMPERHHVRGAAMFGVGWAIAGTCPGPALVMVSSGALVGLVGAALIFNAVAPDNDLFAVPWYWQLVMGGFLFAVVFLATDPVAGPTTGARSSATATP